MTFIGIWELCLCFTFCVCWFYSNFFTTCYSLFLKFRFPFIGEQNKLLLLNLLTMCKLLTLYKNAFTSQGWICLSIHFKLTFVSCHVSFPSDLLAKQPSLNYVHAQLHWTQPSLGGLADHIILFEINIYIYIKL